MNSMKLIEGQEGLALLEKVLNKTKVKENLTNRMHCNVSNNTLCVCVKTTSVLDVHVIAQTIFHKRHKIIKEQMRTREHRTYLYVAMSRLCSKSSVE